jgi:hypothetical protein
MGKSVAEAQLLDHHNAHQSQQDAQEQLKIGVREIA